MIYASRKIKEKWDLLLQLRILQRHFCRKEIWHTFDNSYTINIYLRGPPIV